MPAIDHPGAQMDRGNENRGDAQVIETERCPDDIGDAVAGTNLMKMDFLDAGTVDKGFRLSQRLETGQGQLQHPGRKVGLTEEVVDTGQAADRSGG